MLMAVIGLGDNKAVTAALGVSVGICAPNGGADLIPLDLIAVFVHWVDKNPQALGQQESVGIMAAFQEKWPCN